jgi:cyclic beta-1,2-glucan synthetase
MSGTTQQAARSVIFEGTAQVRDARCRQGRGNSVGRGGWSWYTGAAAWLWRLGVDAILGLRKEAGGLRIDPCIPPAWKGFEAWVRSGHQRVHVVVENPHGIARGVATMALDGAPLATNFVSLDPDASGTHELHVVLGTRVNVGSRSRGAV